MPLVSVVIPVYNRLDLLKYTLDSVFSQTLSDFEVIVVDDGSTDSLSLLIREYGDRVTFIRLPHSGLPSVARNSGINHACGQYIAFLDSDDLWIPEKLDAQVLFFNNNPDLGLVCSDAFKFKGDTTLLPSSRYLNNFKRKAGFLLDNLIDENFIITSTCMVQRKVLQVVGVFSVDPAYRGIEDYELWLRIARQSQLGYIPQPLAFYRDAGVSIRSEISQLQYHKGMDKIYSLLQTELPGTTVYIATHELLARKIFENKLDMACLYLEIEDEEHFDTLFKTLSSEHPFLLPKIYLRMSRILIRKVFSRICRSWKRYE